VGFKVIPDPQAQLAQFLAGAIDWVEVSSDAFPTLRGRPDIQVREVSINRQVVIALNNALPLFSDKRVRKALAMGIDREGVVASLFGGYGKAAVGPIMPVFKWAYPEDVKPLPYDREQAKKLLQEAGWSDTNGDGVVDKDGKPLRFTVLHWPSPYRRILEVAKEQWRQIGVDANVEILEAAATIGKYRSKNYEAAMTWWDTPLDPDVSNYYATQGVSNVYNFKNPGDSLLVRASQLTDQGQRARLYREFQQLMREEQPAIFVFYPVSLQAHSSRVKGLWPTTTVMMTRNFHQVWKE
jgi:peptide/nickel transport system substrate-binding protein